MVVVPEEVSSEEVKKKFESRLIERFQLCCQVDHLFALPIGEGLTNLQYYLESLTNDHPPTQPTKKSTCWLPSSSLALTSSASLSPRTLLMACWYLARLSTDHFFFSTNPLSFLRTCLLFWRPRICPCNQWPSNIDETTRLFGFLSRNNFAI